MIEYRNVRVALLGAGSVGSQVARLLLEHGDELAARAGAGLELVGHRRARRRRAARRRPAARAVHDGRCESLILGADIVVELIGGIEPARTLRAAGAAVGRRRRHRQQGAARDPRPRALRRGRAGRRAALLRGRRRRGDPDHPSAARQPRRRPHRPDHGHRQRHDELHPRPDGHRRRARSRTPWPPRRSSGTPRPTRPPTSRATTPRRRRRSWRASRSTRPVPLAAVHREGITSVTIEQVRAARKAGYVVKILATCERLTDEDGREGVSARVYPALVPESHPLAERARREERRVRRGRGRRRPDVLRRGCRGSRDGLGGPRRPRVRRPSARHRRPGRRRVDPGRPAACFPIGTVRTSYQITLHVADAPGVLVDGRRRARAARRQRRDASSRPPRAPRGPRRSSSARTWRARPTWLTLSSAPSVARTSSGRRQRPARRRRLDAPRPPGR